MSDARSQLAEVSLLLVEYCGGLSGGEFWQAYIFMDCWAANFWVCGSLWMSFSVFVQIYKLLTANKRARRYQPPTRRRVIRDSTIILIFSGVVASFFPFIWLVTSLPDGANDILYWTSFFPLLYLPTLLITGMCIGVWWSELLPRKNARYRSLTLFFARLLASAYPMAIGAVIKQTIQYWPPESEVALNFVMYSYWIYYLFGFFQVCLALTKKDIRDAFVKMWWSRTYYGDDVTSIIGTGGTARTTVEASYGPKVGSYDDEPPPVDKEVNSSVHDQDDDPDENDGDEANTSCVESTEQHEGSVIENETNNKIVMSKEDKNSMQV